MKRLALLLPLLALAAAPARAAFYETTATPLFRTAPRMSDDNLPDPGPSPDAILNQIPSPDGRFMAEVYGSEENTTRWAILRYPDGGRLLLGRSERGVALRWWPTQIGALLSVENAQDTHYDESFVIRPRGETPSGGYEVLFSTARTALPLLEHSYTEVKDVSPGGILTFKHWWDYAPARGNPGSGKWRIPIFLGRDEPETDRSLVRRWCESATFDEILPGVRRVKDPPEAVARAVERLKKDDPAALSAAFAVLLLRDYALQRELYTGGFTLDPRVPWPIVKWEAERLGYPDEFPPSAAAQLVSDMMADAIVRHAGELFADDPVGQVAAAHAKVLLDAVRNHAEDETHAEPAESAAPAPHADSAEGAEKGNAK